MANKIKIGKKSKGEYISAILYSINQRDNSIVVAGLGSQTGKAIDASEEAVQLSEEYEIVNRKKFTKDNLTGVKIVIEEVK